jgi:DNA-binding response OmpR family regulator
MPSISGTTIMRINKMKYPETPITAMTGYGHHPKEIASEAKADLILDKPFEMQVLDKAIKNFLIQYGSSPAKILM